MVEVGLAREPRDDRQSGPPIHRLVQWLQWHLGLHLVQQVRVRPAKVLWRNADRARAHTRVLAQLAALDAHAVERHPAFRKGRGANALEAVVTGDAIAPWRHAAGLERGVERDMAGGAAQRPHRRVRAQR
eukprot:scaffold27997_cov65-Phaeocystis_antarctica.AAC.4